MYKILFVLPVCCLFLMSCFNDYNPFEDKSNIDVKIRTSVSSIKGDVTCTIFARESLTVYPTVFESIDSFIIVSNGNRLWDNPAKTIVKPQAGDQRFYFSWSDTGHVSVSITVYRSDDEHFTRNYDIHVISSLRQDSIVCNVDSACVLFTPSLIFTPALNDPWIRYHWDFGKFSDKSVSYTDYSGGPLSVNLPIGQMQDTGKLWVEDSKGHRSPSVPFWFHFTDSHGPIIKAKTGKQNAGGDTIVTGDSNFVFQVLLFDRGGVRNATINNSTFDDREQTPDGVLVTKVLLNMQSVNREQPQADTVIAVDNSGIQSRKVFYVYFSADGPRNNPIILQMKNPDPSVTITKTTDSSIALIYNLFNYSSDSVYIRANNSVLPSYVKIDTVLSHSDSKMISWVCPLTMGVNSINIEVIRSKSVAESKNIVVERILNLNDSIPPKIPYVLINGNEGERHITQLQQVVCAFYAFSSTGSLRDVTVNGQRATPVPGSPFHYTDTIALTHEGKAINIHVVDQKEKMCDTTIFVRRNSLPALVENTSWQYIAGIKKTDTVTLIDDDGDSVAFTMKINDTNVNSMFSYQKINRRQVAIQWSGVAAVQNGQYNANVTLWDGYQETGTQRKIFITIPGQDNFKAYSLQHSLVTKVDTLSNGTIDLRKKSESIKIDFAIENQLKVLSKTDSIIIENADIVKFSNDPSKFSIVLSNRNKFNQDTVNVIVRNSSGFVDTVGRIPVLYPPISPDRTAGLTYWFGLDKGVDVDYTLREDSLLDWWINRVISVKQMYSYVDGLEPALGTILTPGKLPSLNFGPENTTLINNKNGDLEQGGDWPENPFTLFVVAKLDTSVHKKGVLWSSADYDNIFYAVGVSESGKLSVINKPEGCTNGTAYESKIQLDNSWHIIQIRSSGKNAEANHSTVLMSVSELSNDSVTAPFNGMSGNLMIGGANKHNGNFPWQGQIAEILFYQRSLINKECIEVGAYLRDKHEIGLH